MRIPPSITVERVMEAVKRRATSLDNPGFCLACGEESNKCEPDARRYLCAYCDQRKVYGAEELLMEMI